MHIYIHTYTEREGDLEGLRNLGVLHCRWVLYHLSYQGSHVYAESIYISIYIHIFREREYKSK